MSEMDAKYIKKNSQNFCESFTNSYFYQVRINLKNRYKIDRLDKVTSNPDFPRNCIIF